MIKKIILDLADNRKRDSFATRLRRRRFKLFLNILNGAEKETVTILDVGGTVLFWENMGFDELRKNKKVSITVLNLMPQESEYGFIKTMIGDGRDLSAFRDKEFDIVFSNSVIEHLGTYADQARMAGEAARVGRGYFIQTPNHYFPIEPHFLFPFFQHLPLSWRIYLLCHFNLSWFKKMPEKEAALLAKETRLLKLAELKNLFPDAKIYKEKFLGLTKSFIAYKAVGS